MMSNEQLVSVIIPVYQVEDYLNQCLDSVINQTYSNLEIIIVDDGSTDNCPALCDEWSEKDNRIRVIHKENGGLSDARNKGMQLATGEYIAFVDSDDWIASEMFERLLQAIQKDDSDIAACAVEMVWDNGEKELLTVNTNCVLNHYEAQEALLDETLLKQPVWYKLYRHDAIRHIMFEVGKTHEDVFWSYQAIGNANRVSLVEYIGYYYRQHSDSIMGQQYGVSRLDAVEAIERRYRYLKKYYPKLERKARISILSTCIYHSQMALKNMSKSDQKIVFQYLNDVVSRYSFSRSDYNEMKITHRVWFDIGRLSLKLVGCIKNILHVGI